MKIVAPKQQGKGDTRQDKGTTIILYMVSSETGSSTHTVAYAGLPT
jgi:hypothetical protein